MRPALSTFAGLVYGLLVAWLSLYSFSRMGLQSTRPQQGCGDIEHCGGHWWQYAGLLLVLFGPSLVFACAGYLAAARQWPMVRRAVVFVGLTGLAVLVYWLSYVL